MTAGTDTGASNSDDITNDNTPTFTGSFTTSDTVNLYSDGVFVTSVTCAASLYSLTPGSALTDGAHTITTTFTDLANNESSASPGL